MHPMLNVAVRAARQAGRLINRASVDVDTMQVTRKERNDFVTEVDRASEAAIIADLETHGLDVQQLREVLRGAHVLVDRPELYDAWRFPKSRERLSSHHRTVDKQAYPDLGLKGPLVREKLHGRTAAGTWIQLEKTPASMGKGFHMPGINDLKHLVDHIVYRTTTSNVGPWGLSGLPEPRPMSRTTCYCCYMRTGQGHRRQRRQ